MKASVVTFFVLSAVVFGQAQPKTHLALDLMCGAKDAPDYKDFNSKFCKQLWTKLLPMTYPGTHAEDKSNKKKIALTGHWQIFTYLLPRPGDNKVLLAVRVIRGKEDSSPLTGWMSTDPVAQANNFAAQIIDYIVDELAKTL